MTWDVVLVGIIIISFFIFLILTTLRLLGRPPFSREK